MKRAILFETALILLLLGAGSSWAIPPDQGQEAFTFDGCPLVKLYDCGEFEICEAGDLQYRWKLFYYNNGDPKKRTEKVKFDGILYRFDDPDKYLAYNPLSFTFTYRYVENESSLHGVYAMITVPGYGQIFRDVGHIAFEPPGRVTFEAGEHQWWNDEFDAVCTYLAGD